MRKAEKKQAENFIEVLDQAHAEIKASMDNHRTDAARELLEQCQEGAICLGELIEAREGARHAAIPLLEAYCETVYRIHEELGSSVSGDGRAVYQSLKQSLAPAADCVKNDIATRPEIVFLPYKAAMWDSLESIWMAAQEDPECDAYVIPIPYYDRNPDGSLGRCHYEGNDLPDYVPVMHYDTYSLEINHPDIIYIHNPYDKNNYVTSVDPRFYSDQLKKYTQKLVYVPYYATSGGMSEGQALCPAYLNASYIVVQAEKYRQFFDPIIPDTKFLALGSPKFPHVSKSAGAAR